jgi:argininosuccinate lyase
MSGWKGRFSRRIDEAALKFSTSLPFDARLADEDIAGSLAHVDMLARKGIVPKRDAARIRKALTSIRKEIASGKLDIRTVGSKGGRFVAEDVHMAIEAELTRRIGHAGGKIHTARSRNDQIALDERLFLRTTIVRITGLITKFQKAALRLAEKNRAVIIHGYTHLQQAQPVLLAHHLLAYVEMLERDRERFADCAKRANRSPLGAGALAGTLHSIDRNATAKTLGFDAILENSIDAVSDRDVLVEFTSACAITMMHLSRFAEECVIWSSQEWGLLEIGDEYTTGSSMMPQKKNPDMAELIRGKSGRVYGDLVALLTIMKGLPLSYNRDLQEDKEPLFDAADTVLASLEIFTGMLGSMKFRKDSFFRTPQSDFVFATDLADYCVKKGMPFRAAHAVVGKIISICDAEKIGLRQLPLERYRKESPLFQKDLFKLFDPHVSVAARRSAGSTSPSEVAKAIQRWKRQLARQ